MAFVPLARGPGLAKERTREDMLVVRPDASTTQTWGKNGSVCSSQFVWVASLERVRVVRLSAQTVSDSPIP
jgi:hypothetical protein